MKKDWTSIIGKNGEIDPPAPFEIDPHAPLQIDPLKTEQIDPYLGSKMRS
jgi:hypothetical protein